MTIDRRTFIAAGTTALAAAPQIAAAAPKKRNIVKSLKIGMLPRKGKNGKVLSMEERLQTAVDAGFESVEPDTIFEPAKVEEMKKAADKIGLKLDAIICSKHWSHPLSDPNPKTVQVCLDAMKVSMQNAKDLGGDMVLLVPANVVKNVMYKDAYERSLKHVKELAGLAAEMKITIGLENVWNKFLLSPLEFKHYLEEVNSPWVKSWFDVGNIVLYGYPQDWIRTLRDWIARVDVKDFNSKRKQFVPLMKDGSIDWAEVMKAFDEIGYEGVFAAEVSGGDLNYLKTMVSEPMDKMIAM